MLAGLFFEIRAFFSYFAACAAAFRVVDIFLIHFCGIFYHGVAVFVADLRRRVFGMAAHGSS